MSTNSRKIRSIGRVARDMLSILPANVDPGSECVFSVMEVMTQLGCCRGAVYEVIHVLEALLLVTRIGTNLFRWNGFVHLNSALAFLKHIACAIDISGDIDLAHHCEVTSLIGKQREDHETENKEKRKPHILRVCQKFLMIFLVLPPDTTITLEFAARVIHGASLPESKLKSRTRRLYDISNVLLNLPNPLLEKVFIYRITCASRNGFRFLRPADLNTEALCISDVLSLPEYRRKHLYFDVGMSALGIPERPTRIPGMKFLSFSKNQLDEAFTPCKEVARVMFDDSVGSYIPEEVIETIEKRKAKISAKDGGPFPRTIFLLEPDC